MFKKILSCAVIAAMLLSMAVTLTAFADDSVSVWDGMVVGETGGFGWFQNTPEVQNIIHAGSGTLHIDSAAKLAALALCVGRTSAYAGYTVDELKLAGVTVSLDTDIDLNGHAWSPIASFGNGAPFLGTFEGNGHTIYGMANTPTDTDGLFANNRNTNGKKYFGLIGFLGGTVRNVKIKNASWTYSGNISMPFGGCIAAALADWNANSYQPVIDNCAVENCTFTVNNTNASPHAAHGFAGIVGSVFNGSITNCYVKDFTIDVSGSSTVPAYCEGIANVNRCQNKAKVWDIKYNFMLRSKLITADGEGELPFMYYSQGANYSYADDGSNLNCTDGGRVSGSTYPNLVENEDGLKNYTLYRRENSAFYSEGAGKPVILKWEANVSGLTVDYDLDLEKVFAKANFAKAENGSMLILAYYDIVNGNEILRSVDIHTYNKASEFNQTVAAEISAPEFDDATQIAKAFVINPNWAPYLKPASMGGE